MVKRFYNHAIDKEVLRMKLFATKEMYVGVTSLTTLLTGYVSTSRTSPYKGYIVKVAPSKEPETIEQKYMI